jgi:hypothetical protein
MSDGTLKVTPITAAQPQAHAKFSITASIDGFPITVEVEGKADALRGMIDRLKAIGAQPPIQTPAQASTPWQPKKAAPICPDHGTPMKASRKPGTYFCPRRTDDGDYCPEKA